MIKLNNMDNHESGTNLQPLPSETQVEAEIDSQINGMTNTEKDAFGLSLKLNAINDLNELRKMEEKFEKQTDKSKITEAKKKAVIDLEKLVIASKKNIKINDNLKTQILIKGLAEKSLFEDELIDIFKNFEEYLLGNKEILMTTSINDQQPSEFEIEIMQMYQTNAEATRKMIEVLVDNAHDFGKEPNELRKRFDRLIRSFESQSVNPQIEELYSNFPKKQKEFVYALHDPKEFLKIIDKKMEEKSADTSHIRIEVKEEYVRQYGEEPIPEELESLIKRQVQMKVSEEIGREISDILTLIYRQLGIERSHKDFNTVSNEDFMRGIVATKNIMSRALQGLESNFRIMEFEDPNNPDYFRMQKLTEEDSDTIELNINGNIRPQPRTKPLPYFDKVKMSKFITNQWTNFYHWQDATGYFHDIAVVLNHPPHEGSIWSSVKGFAANMKMASLDGFYNLPNGPLTIRAYHLLEKFKQEEFAKIDHKIQADMDTNQLEAVNTKIEAKVISYLMMDYKGDQMSEVRIASAINNAVGMAKGIYLSEHENIAYADAENATQSYGTLDATPINVLNPLHTILRWGGPQNLRPVLFLPADGEKRSFWKSLFGIPQYDHNITYKNASDVLDSFINLKKGREGSMMNLAIDKILNLTRTADFVNRSGWRDYFSFSPHFIYDQKGNLKLLDSFKSMDIIGYQPINWFLKNIGKGIDRSGKTYLEKIDPVSRGNDDPIKKEFIRLSSIPRVDMNEEDRKMMEVFDADISATNQREELFEYLYKQYFEPFVIENNGHKDSYQEYIEKLRTRAEVLVKEGKDGVGGVKNDGTLPFDDYNKAVQKQISDLFVQGAISRVVAARFPTKFLRIDRDRLHKEGGSRWRQRYEKMKESNKDLTRDQFGDIMNDLGFVEECIQNDTSAAIKEKIHLLPLDDKKNRSLGEHVDLLQNLDRKKIREVLESRSMDEKRIKKVEELYELILNKMKEKSEARHEPNGKEIPGTRDLDFLDGEAVYAIEEFPFNIGQENTDFSLIPYRATGPNTLVRAIGDMAMMDEVVIKGFLDLPIMFSEIAANGGDYSPLIQYLQKCQKTFNDVHGIGDSYDFNYMVAGMFVNYMRKDDKAAPGRINSIAGQIAGDSNLVKEFDFKDIDRFYLAMQQKGLLLKENYDITKGPELEDIWKIDKKTGKPVMTGSKKIKEIYKSCVKRARERFGGDWKEGLANVFGKILPLVMMWLIYQYLKKAFEETFGAKKG
mgnify:CR=1 FL=1